MAHGQSRICTHSRGMNEITIIGGGLVGGTLALGLAQHGFSVTVIDAHAKGDQSRHDFDGRSYALAQSSVRLLTVLGLWADLQAHAQPILQVKASDGRAGQGPAPWHLHFDHGELGQGPMGFMAEDRFVRRALASALSDTPNITQIFNHTVVAQDGGTVTLDNGKTITAQMIVGCDGRQSGTATRAGIKRRISDYGQTALVCAIDHTLPHDGIAHQFFMPEGPLAILPLPGNRSSIVWSDTTQRATAINALNDAEYLQFLRPRFGDFLGDISLTGARFTYPLTLTMAQTMTAPRLALAGDAAHGMHPIAGQGLNLGLRDVATLIEVLTLAKRRGEDFTAADVLQRYADWRHFDCTTMAAATDGFKRLFSNDNAILRPLRDLGMAVVSSAPGLRRAFMREAAGVSGDLPRLLQGKTV